MKGELGWRQPEGRSPYGDGSDPRQRSLGEPAQGPYPGEALGNSMAGGQAQADLAMTAFSPGGRRGGGACPRAGRGLPGDPGPAAGPAHPPAAIWAALIPQSAAMLRPCAADKRRGA